MPISYVHSRVKGDNKHHHSLCCPSYIRWILRDKAWWRGAHHCETQSQNLPSFAWLNTEIQVSKCLNGDIDCTAACHEFLRQFGFGSVREIDPSRTYFRTYSGFINSGLLAPFEIKKPVFVERPLNPASTSIIFWRQIFFTLPGMYRYRSLVTGVGLISAPAVPGQAHSRPRNCCHN
jgi:hypothetical protein